MERDIEIIYSRDLTSDVLRLDVLTKEIIGKFNQMMITNAKRIVLLEGRDKYAPKRSSNFLNNT